MAFYTAINCMDGRTQVPVVEYLKRRLGVEYVDMITEPGPNRILAEQDDFRLVDSILLRVNISVEKHGSVGIAVVGHHDCAGNPVGYPKQVEHTRAAIEYLAHRYGQLPILGLWVDESWQVHEIDRE